MRIDDWPLDRIMRLPDWCFGRRHWVGTYAGATNGHVSYWLVEEQLPDKFVVWSIMMCCNCPLMLNGFRVTVRLGFRVPVDAAEVLGLERLCKGISRPNIVYEFYVNPNGLTYMNQQRLLIESTGRRICLMVNGDQENPYESTVGVLISSVPKEVPDWLVSNLVNIQW